MSNNVLGRVFKPLMLTEVPAYANKFFYSLGFLSLISFLMLLVTGIVMSFFGPTWWLTSSLGIYTRSVHMWATQAFVIFIILHLIIVILTSAYKAPRRYTWVLGVLMLMFVIFEAEFGAALRGDFSSQWRSLQGADFYNGAGLGYWINAINHGQIYGIHIAVIPIILLVLLSSHYIFVRVLGIAKPYRSDVKVKTVQADHNVLFLRGGLLIVAVLALAVWYPSPFMKSITIQGVAREDAATVNTTLVAEFDRSSDTATYKDNIAPYNFDTRQVYIVTPYEQWYASQKVSTPNELAAFLAQPADVQDQQLKDLSDYYAKADDSVPAPKNQASLVIASLLTMAKAGLYEPALAANNASDGSGNLTTYTARFLADTGVLEDKAKELNMTTEQYGMLHEEQTNAPGAWWLYPIGVLNHTVLANDENGDRDAALIFGSIFLLLFAFPFIPWVNQIPDKLQLWRFIWRTKK